MFCIYKMVKSLKNKQDKKRFVFVTGVLQIIVFIPYSYYYRHVIY